MKRLTEEIRTKYYAFPSASNEELVQAKRDGIPEKLLDFYRECDGCFIGFGEEHQAPNGNEYQLKILRLSEVENVQNFGFIQDDTPLYSKSKEWWQFITIGGDNFYAFDNNTDGLGRILDVPHEEVGYEKCHAIIANSIIELIQQLLDNNGQDWFSVEQWQEKGWI